MYFVGYQLDNNRTQVNRLSTEDTALACLNVAIKTRVGQCIKGVIFHSDGGGQYYDKEFLKLTNEHGIQNSMCEFAWENGQAERINGVIKNNYLIHRSIKSFDELVKEVDRTVYLYNHDKPHFKLQRKTPIEFEKKYIYAWEKKSMVKSQRLNKKTIQNAGHNSLVGCLGKEVSSSNIALE
jgi:transposase InsO family protein